MGNMPSFKEMTAWKGWWMLKTGWDENEYVDRKNALLRRLREEFVNKTGTYLFSTLASKIRTLVVNFDDSSWCLPGEQDPTVRFAEQLRLYTKWAKHIQSDRAKISDDEWYSVPNTMDNLSSSSIIESTTPPATLNWRPIENGHESTVRSSPATMATAAGVVPLSTTKEPFDWDDVEICIDLHEYEWHCFNIPMTILRSGYPGEPCHWYDFTFRRFYEVLKQESGESYQSSRHSIFWIEGKEWVEIKTASNYASMLKRFSEESNARDVLNLFVYSSSRGNPTCLGSVGWPNHRSIPDGENHAAMPRSLKRKAPLE